MSRNVWKFGEMVESLAYRYHKSRFGVQVRFETKFTQRVFGDFSYLSDGKSVRCDVKGEQSPSVNFPIETMQDLKSAEPGWMSHLQQCDEIFYVQCAPDFGPGIGVVRHTSRISLRGLRHWFRSARSNLRRVETDRGYGLTEIFLAPLEELRQEGIASIDTGGIFAKFVDGANQ